MFDRVERLTGGVPDVEVAVIVGGIRTSSIPFDGTFALIVGVETIGEQ